MVGIGFTDFYSLDFYEKYDCKLLSNMDTTI